MKSNNINVLVIAAHPDDEVYGMGGTIAKLTDEGTDVYLLVITDGSTSQYRDSEDIEKILETKKLETKKAASILGIKEIIYGNLPDMKLDTVAHIEVNAIIENIIEKIKPECVYTHFYGDINLDHQMVYKSTLVAARPVSGSTIKELYAYQVPSCTEWSPNTASTIFVPNTYVDIYECASKKVEAIKAYRTELRDYPHPRSIEAVKSYDKTAGLQVGLEYAECFILLRRVK